MNSCCWRLSQMASSRWSSSPLSSSLLPRSSWSSRGPSPLPSSFSPTFGGIAHSRGMATKKSGGSTTNGRDSAGRRLGIKVWPNVFCNAGSILVRQRGQKFRAGNLVGMGKDHTLFALASGTVYMTRLPTNRKRNVVHIRPAVDAATAAAALRNKATASHP